MRFVHTADWQIGMKADGLGAVGVKVREQRLETAKRVVEVANRFDAEFLLVAGDVFEHNAVNRTLVRKIVETFATFAGPVYIIPGNHDPYVPGSVWEHPGWDEKSNLKVLTTREPIELTGGWLFPCPLFEKNSMADPTAWINTGDRDGFKIGLAHGTVEGVPQEELDYPIPRDAATRRGLDYLALGHWHSVARYTDAANAVRMAYSGTHETSKFGERDSGKVLKVIIDKPGAAPEIQSEEVGSLKWEVIEHPLQAAGDFQKLRLYLDAIESPERALLDIRLSGVLAATDRSEYLRLQELVQAGIFLFAHVDDEQLLPAPSDDGWLAGLPSGVVREVAEELRRLAQPGYAGTRAEGATPQVAGRAILELYALLQEASQ